MTFCRRTTRGSGAGAERQRRRSFEGGGRARARGRRVIPDSGHGGRDTGTLHDGLWEATYVYDVACRLRKVLEERTRAEVLMTTKDAAIGWTVPDQDRLRARRSQTLLTQPPYALDDPSVGVNLRWYLANSFLKRPAPDGKSKVAPEKTVFLSLHADSLHPSVRGAMIYVPESYLRERYGSRGGLRRVPRGQGGACRLFNKREARRPEGASTALAEGLVAALRDGGLPVHSFSPVRTHVIRAGTNGCRPS